MRKTRQSLFYILLLNLMLLMTACESSNVDLDNGGEETLKVTIDNTSYTLLPGGRSQIELKKGQHTVKVVDPKDKTLREEIFVIEKGGLLNVAGAEYFIWKDIFSPQSTLNIRQTLLNLQELKIDKKIYELDFTMLPTEQVYTEQGWDFRLNEDFPEKVYGWEMDKNKHYTFKTRLIRKSEFSSVYAKSLQ